MPWESWVGRVAIGPAISLIDLDRSLKIVAAITSCVGHGALPGEIVPTGTFTAALPQQPGETSCTETEGLALPTLTVQRID
jgi:adenylosuccinate synthase